MTNGKERRRLLKAPDVRAILERRKTVLRIPVKPQPSYDPDYLHGDEFRIRAPYDMECPETGCVYGYGFQLEDEDYPCPAGRPGDRMWVGETFWVAQPYSHGTCPSGEQIIPYGVQWGPVHYAADGDPPNTPNKHYPHGLQGGAFAAPDPYGVWVKRPSIHMPRWASRITLRVLDVGVGRLQEIDDDQCIAEGMDGTRVWASGASACNESGELVCQQFWTHWNKIHGPGSFEANPWVWIVAFEVLEP